MGKNHGKKKEEMNPGNTDREEYVKAYNKGYRSGIKKTITKEGKKFAKTNYSVKVPKEYKNNKDYSKWFKQGFKSNKKAAEVRKAGFKKERNFFQLVESPKSIKSIVNYIKKPIKKARPLKLFSFPLSIGICHLAILKANK